MASPMVSSTSWETLVPMSKQAFSRWVTLAEDDAFLPWRRIVPLVLTATKLSDGHPDDEDAAFEFGFRHAVAEEEIEIAVLAAIASGQLTLLGPDSRFPLTNQKMRPAEAVVSRSQLSSFLAGHGIGIRTPTGSPLEADASPDSALSAAATQAEAFSQAVTHRLESRAHPMSAVIAKAADAAVDRHDYQSVWSSLVGIAQSPAPPRPVIGYVDGEGVQYQTSESDEPKYYTKDALRKRMNRRSRGR